jgi:hemolysin activation/secretion protein
MITKLARGAKPAYRGRAGLICVIGADVLPGRRGPAERKGLGKLLLCAALLLLGRAAIAAPAPAVPLPGAVQPGHERELPTPPPPPEFDFSIEQPHRSPVPRAVDEIRFVLKDIRIEGAVSLPAARFRPLYQGLIGKQISLRDVFNVADSIEQEYRAAGYPLIRAYVPPQHVKDGNFEIRIIEGFVAGVSVDGADPATRARVRTYMEPLLHVRPLREATIERALLLANDIPGVAATGVLRPSPNTPGAADLAVTLTQPLVSGGLAANNRGSRYTGIWTTTGTAAYNGIFGADEIDATLSLSPHALEQLDGTLRYRTAIGDDGLLGSIILSGQKGVPGGSLGPLDIHTKSWAIGPRLTYPIERTRNESLSLDGGLTFQDASVDISGLSQLSHDTWRVADIALTYTRRDSLGGLFTSTIDAAQGLPILGASPDHSPDLSLLGRSDFTKFTGAAHYTNWFAPPFSVALAAEGQYACEPLIEGEQVLFGGTNIGRGYDPGAITGDSGLGSSAELRYDRPLPQYFILNLQPYVFFDAAKVWNRSEIGRPVLGDMAIDSTGGGLRFWFPYNVYLDLEGATTLRAVPGSDHGERTTKFLMDIAVAS